MFALEVGDKVNISVMDRGTLEMLASDVREVTCIATTGHFLAGGYRFKCSDGPQWWSDNDDDCAAGYILATRVEIPPNAERWGREKKQLIAEIERLRDIVDARIDALLLMGPPGISVAASLDTLDLRFESFCIRMRMRRDVPDLLRERRFFEKIAEIYAEAIKESIHNHLKGLHLDSGGK